MIELYAVRLCDQEKQSKLGEILVFLSEEKRDKIGRFRKWQDKERAAISELLIRIIAGKKLRVKNKDISLLRDDYGKPFLAGIYNFHFNISHSGKWVVCAVDNQRLGIDIEEMRPVDYDIVKSFFCTSEFKQLSMKSEIDKLEYFYELWTLKESYIKAEGKGLSIPLDSFEIYKENNIVKVRAKNLYQDYFFKQYNLESNYKLAVCGMDNNFQQFISVKEYHGLIDEFIEFVAKK